MVIGMCNLIECWDPNPYNNETCDRWYIPSGAGVLFFCMLEVVGWISYLCFF